MAVGSSRRGLLLLLLGPLAMVLQILLGCCHWEAFSPMMEPACSSCVLSTSRRAMDLQRTTARRQNMHLACKPFHKHNAASFKPAAGIAITAATCRSALHSSCNAKLHAARSNTLAMGEWADVQGRPAQMQGAASCMGRLVCRVQPSNDPQKHAQQSGLPMQQAQ